MKSQIFSPEKIQILQSIIDNLRYDENAELRDKLDNYDSFSAEEQIDFKIRLRAIANC